MLNRFEWERYAKASAARANLEIVWHDQKVAATDGTTLFLPYMPANSTEEDWKRIRHYVAHEVDHILYTDFEEYRKLGCNPLKSFLGAIQNCVEDARVERKGALEYEGDRLNSNDVHYLALSRITKDASDAYTKAKDANEKAAIQKMVSLICWVNREYMDIYPSAVLVQEGVEKVLDIQGKVWFDKLVNGDYSAVLKSLREDGPKRGTEGTRELAKRIFREVYGLDPKEEQERQKENGKGKKEEEEEEGDAGGGAQEGEESDGEGGDKEEGGKESDGGESEDEEGEGKGKKESKDTRLKKPTTIKWAEFWKDEHQPKGTGRQDKHLDLEGYKVGDRYTPSPLSRHIVVDHSTKEPTPMEGWVREINSALSHTSDAFAHRVRMVLQIRDKDRYQYGTKKGKLHGSSLHRVVLRDAPGYNERVFKRKIENDVLNSCVSILVDMSGSMSGHKYAHAAAAAVMLSEVVGNVLHVPVEVNTFADTGDKPREHIIRKFSEKLVPKEKLIARLASAPKSGMTGNPDGEAISWAYDRIIQRKEKRKVLIVLSDGSPASYCCLSNGGGDIIRYTKSVVDSIEKTPVRIIGIGIMDTNVTKFYKEHYVIKSPAELENALLAVVEKQLR